MSIDFNLWAKKTLDQDTESGIRIRIKIKPWIRIRIRIQAYADPKHWIFCMDFSHFSFKYGDSRIWVRLDS